MCLKLHQKQISHISHYCWPHDRERIFIPIIIILYILLLLQPVHYEIREWTCHSFLPLTLRGWSFQIFLGNSSVCSCSGSISVRGMHQWSLQGHLFNLIHVYTSDAPISPFKGPFTLHCNCIAVLIYRLLSAVSHCSTTAFQVEMNLTLMRHRNAVWQCSTVVA